MRPFDVQILGGVVLHQGNIAEMVTGEGKTLVAILPVYLNALTGKGVHVVTVNDYLARRDMEWMRPVHEFLGLTVGLIQSGMHPAEKKVGYRADITYATNNELGFDYLRDNMAKHPDERVQRNLNYAIVDEVDSILIDEARTPLIISGRPEKSSDVYLKVDDVVKRLRKEEHYTVDEKQKHIILTDEGMGAAERGLGVEDLYADDTIGLVHMIEQSLKAYNFFRRDKEYMVKDGQVMIVDEHTGRVMEGRRYSDGLHQALEAKERVPLQFESQTVASVTYQNFFRLYDKLAGMTGTALTEAAEFHKVYGLEVVPIPTNLPMQRDDQTDLIFATERGKFKYVVDEIKRVREQGRPVLVGTVSIEKSELVASLLEKEGIHDYQVLNAKHHEREAAIVSNAGKRGAITVATNMAGRGTDIKLAEGVREAGGLYIIGTERHESRRIDNQLRGRCGRQGDPGTTRFYVSLEDEVARLFGGDKVKWLIDRFGGDEMDAEPLSQRMVSRRIEQAQRQVEELNFEGRKHVLEYDDVMDRQRKYIYRLRNEVLEDKDVRGRVEEMFKTTIGDAVDEYAPEDDKPENWDIEGLEARLAGIFGVEFDAAPPPGEAYSIESYLQKQALDEYEARHQYVTERLREEYRKTVGGDESKIDFAEIARQRIGNLEKTAILSTVDDRWIGHLYDMDYLRESVRLRAFGQRDPLLEYKREGFELFQNMVRTIEETVIRTVFRATDPERSASGGANRGGRGGRPVGGPSGESDETEDFNARMQHYNQVAAARSVDQSFASVDTGQFALARRAKQAQEGRTSPSEAAPPPKKEPVRVEKVAPNAKCPCGSGKKYKKCCGRPSN